MYTYINICMLTHFSDKLIITDLKLICSYIISFLCVSVHVSTEQPNQFSAYRLPCAINKKAPAPAANQASQTY